MSEKQYKPHEISKMKKFLKDKGYNLVRYTTQDIINVYNKLTK